MGILSSCALHLQKANLELYVLIMKIGFPTDFVSKKSAYRVTEKIDRNTHSIHIKV